MNDDDLRGIRRHLHKHPELSGEEKNTRDFITQSLKNVGLEKFTTVGETGILVSFNSGKPGKSLLIRADIDALPIEEENSFEHRSVTEAVSHKCGHDGHTTILLGLADDLLQRPIQKGEVHLLFQPAEETGTGAKKVLEDENFRLKPDYAFALHNIPGYPLHQILSKPGSFTAAVKSLIIKLHGHTSHAAEPEMGNNPGLALAEILQLSQSLLQEDVSRDDFRLVTMIYASLGERAYGTSAGYGEVHFTLRCWQNAEMKKLEEQFMGKVKSICDKHDLRLETEWLEVFHANHNNQETFEKIKLAAEKAGLDFKELKEAFKWGEDFGLFTEKFNGAMFGIGAGTDSPALHNADYDFPDEIIGTGISMFRGIINESL